jgi:hypothetical protein
MAQREPPSAAQALYGHLPSAARAERPEPKGSSLRDLWPGPKPPPGWRSEDIALIKRAVGSDAEVARRYGVSKEVVGQIRKLGG